MADSSSLINRRNGYNPVTKIYTSLRPSVQLPDPDDKFSITEYVFSLLLSNSKSDNISLDETTVLIDATLDRRLSYTQFLTQVKNLSFSLRTQTRLRKGDVAYVISPPSLSVPVLYLALLSLGIVVSPGNPVSSESEIAHQVELSKPVVAFATSGIFHKIPNLPRGTILIDSDFFASMVSEPKVEAFDDGDRIVVSQSDPAAILYSSGTTGKVKGVLLTHRNFITLIAGINGLNYEDDEEENSPHPISLFTIPLFHVFGLIMLVRAVATGETLVLMERFDFEGMLRAVEKFRINYMPVSPPLVVALTKSELVKKYDISSLLLLGSGGAPLGKEVSDNFSARFPDVMIVQGYGMTETTGGAARMIGPEEAKKFGSVGRLSEMMEAKIVDPETGEALPPGKQGELWLRGPTIMKGYVGNEEATAATLDPEGWLKTGDLCYFDEDGFLYIVDRLKELIKYKAYQVPPAELELILHTHPEIDAAAVVPYPDEEAGEIPMAFVVRKPGSRISEAEVMSFVAKQVAPYKKVRRVAFINSIPTSPAGKILRRELVTQAVSGPSAKL